MPDGRLAETLIGAESGLPVADRSGRRLRPDLRRVLRHSSANLPPTSRGAALPTSCRPKAPPLWGTRLQRVFAGESLHIRELADEGTWNISVFPVRVDGDIRYAGGLAREITPWGSAEQELRHTVLGALKAQEFERNMLSKFLHDSVGQNLTALGLQLDLIRMDLETTAPGRLCAHRAKCRGCWKTIMEEVREYSYELNPSAVERAGLRAALDRLAARLPQRFTGEPAPERGPVAEARPEGRFGHVTRSLRRPWRTPCNIPVALRSKSR